MSRTLGQSTSVQDLIAAAAARYGVPANLATAQARAESNFNQNAVSPAGAIGVFQLMPATAAWLGVDPYNIEQNIDGGVRYLSQLLTQYGGDVKKALAAYNWGPGNLAKSIAKHGDGWLGYLPTETANYIARITGAIGDVLPAGTDTETIALFIVGGVFLFLLLRG